MISSRNLLLRTTLPGVVRRQRYQCLFRSCLGAPLLEQGWVYVLVNPAIPGLVKVGRTTRLPSTRVAELSHATGVPTPFILVFEQSFEDCVGAERDIHAALDRCGMRVAPNREFFRGATTEVVRLVLQYARETSGEDTACSLQSGSELLQQGDRCLFGRGINLQDLTEAVSCYQLAVERGSLLAFERLGVIIAQTRGATRGGRARAATLLKEGAQRGNYYCYCDLAAAAAEEGNIANFIKAWDLFFSNRQAAWLAEVEDGDDRYPTALRRYVVTCFALGLRPGHLPALTAEADALVRTLTKTLDGVRSPLVARRMLIVSLQWAKEALLHVPRPRPTGVLVRNWVPRLTERWRGVAA